MNMKANELFIQVKGIGLAALIDKRMRHNLINPALLAFFNLGERRMYSLSMSKIGEVNTRPTYDHSQPFLPDYVNAISTNDVFHYVGKKVGRCKDDKLRICKVFRLEFEHEGHTFSFPFLLDKSLNEAVLLGKEAIDRITETVMKQKQETCTPVSAFVGTGQGFTYVGQ